MRKKNIEIELIVRKIKNLSKVSVLVFSVGFFLSSVIAPAFSHAATGDAEIADQDYEKYLKYDKYKKYTKRKKYRKYNKARKKYGFDSSSDKFAAKTCYRKIKDLRKKGVSKAQTKSDSCYKKYSKYKKYKKYYSPYKKYRKYKKYDKDEYDHSSWGNYGTSENKSAYDRYERRANSQANLGGGALGPEIRVGLHEFTEDSLEDHSFRIRAYKASTGVAVPYSIKDENGDLVVDVAAAEDDNDVTKVKYDGSENLRVYDYDEAVSDEEKIVNEKVRFVAKNQADENDIYFEYSHDDISSSYVKYRDGIELNHYNESGSSTNDRIWVINFLPLEHYVWGMSEITGTGDHDYNRVMTISYRTYGYWQIKYSTKFAKYDFKVNATPGNQLYSGYRYEVEHDDIRTAAEETRAKIVMYDHRIAITPYSSYTDGRTRSFEERWGSTNYPWCQSVSDPYGEHPSMTTAELVAAGNHMVGLSAHGALDRAAAGWDYERILKYYYDGIDLDTAY